MFCASGRNCRVNCIHSLRWNMGRNWRLLARGVLISLGVFYTCYLMYRSTQVWSSEDFGSTPRQDAARSLKPTITIAATCCGNKTDELRTLLKSAILFGQDAHVDVRILSDDACARQLQPLFEDLQEGVNNLRSEFTWKVLPTKANVDVRSWDFDPTWTCSFFRLFLPDILTDVDNAFYMDLDTILVSNLTKIWQDFAEDQRRKPNSVATVMDHVPVPATYSYPGRGYPFFGHTGINAGVIFMNLTRMRALNFTSLVVDVHDRFINSTFFTDQDLLNVLLGEHRDNASLFDCTYNFNPANCGWGYENCWGHTKEEGPLCFCWKGFETGIKVVHGFSHVFHNDMIPAFRQLYEAIRDMRLEMPHSLKVISELQSNVSSLPQKCFVLTGDALYANALNYLEAVNSRQRLKKMAARRLLQDGRSRL